MRQITFPYTPPQSFASIELEIDSEWREFVRRNAKPPTMLVMHPEVYQRLAAATSGYRLVALDNVAPPKTYRGMTIYMSSDCTAFTVAST